MFENNSTLVMIGDSVTDVGRARPIANNKKEELGRGYPALVDAMLTAYAPELNMRIVNMGISGNNVRSLEERWQADVLDLQPDYVSCMIGINDIWRQFDCPQLPYQHVYYDEFISTYEKLVAKTVGQVKSMYLISCCFMEPNRQEPMRALVDKYNAGAKALSEKYHAVYVDAQSSFDKVLNRKHPMFLTWDRVHPLLGGHMVIAKAFLEAAGIL